MIEFGSVLIMFFRAKRFKTLRKLTMDVRMLHVEMRNSNQWLMEPGDILLVYFYLTLLFAARLHHQWTDKIEVVSSRLVFDLFGLFQKIEKQKMEQNQIIFLVKNQLMVILYYRNKIYILNIQCQDHCLQLKIKKMI